MKVTITVDEKFLNQLLDSAEQRALDYQHTADYHEGNAMPDDERSIISGVDEVEARKLAEFIARSVRHVREQLSKRATGRRG